MEISATTVIVTLLFVALYVTLLVWRHLESRKMQELIVTLLLPPNADVERLAELEEKLAEAVEKDATGRLNGDQFRADGCTIYFKGPSAERLYQSVLQPLKDFRPNVGSYLIKRYGAEGAREERVDL